ncbi:flippase-like domain-containing protein [Nanohaloarchaea archaeon]|nr:flippase-like domain-containing protein [Candidatus Nanohaloarchaea archaeon]
MNDKVVGKLKNSKIVWYAVSSLIVLSLAYVANFGDFISALKSINRFYMLLSLISGLSVFLVWGYVWHSFFEELDMQISLFKSYKIFMAGTLMNSITPLGQAGGEPFMAFVISDNAETSYEKALSSVVSADLVNAIPFIAYLIVAVIYLLAAGSINNIVWQAVYLLTGIGVILAASGYIILYKRSSAAAKIYGALDYLETKSIVERRHIETVKRKMDEIHSNFSRIGEDPKHLVRVTAISHLAPLTQYVSMYFILLGLGIQPGVTEVFLTIILGGLAMWSPTPGGSGTVEAAMSGLLVALYPGIGLDTALAAAVLFRFTTYWPGILIGYISLIDLKR